MHLNKVDANIHRPVHIGGRSAATVITAERSMLRFAVGGKPTLFDESLNTTQPFEIADGG